MSEYHQPNNRRSAKGGARRGAKSAKDKNDIDVEVLPTLFGDWRRIDLSSFMPNKLPTEAEERAFFADLPNFPFMKMPPGDDGLPMRAHTGHLDPIHRLIGCGCHGPLCWKDSTILETTLIPAAGGAPIMCELRCHVSRDGPNSKRFAYIFRGFGPDARDHLLKVHQGYFDQWHNLADVGLFIPSGAPDLVAAIKAAEADRSTITLFICEGNHSKRGLERRFAHPDNAAAIAAYEKENNTKIVVIAWLAGVSGAERTNFALKAGDEVLLLGQNDFEVHYASDVVRNVIIVPDADPSGDRECKIVAERLMKEYALPRDRLRKAARVPHLRAEDAGWDDDNDLPPGVTEATRLDQLLNAPDYEEPAENEVLEYVMDRGKPAVVDTNIKVFISLASNIAKQIYFDEFKWVMMLRGPLPQQKPRGKYPRRLEDDDLRALVALVQRSPYFTKATKEHVTQGVKMFADTKRINPVLDYLDGLQWDGGMRVDTALIDYLGAEATEDNCEVSRVFLLSLVARAYEPGCKADQSMVLIGPQRFKKSTFLRKIAGDEYFSDCLPELGGGNKMKEAMAHLKGRWLVEISEAASIIRAEVTRLKSFITTQVDIFRHPWGYLDGEHPRQGVFAVTANDNSMFRDDTGARRFLPVDIGVKFRPTNEHMRLLEENRDQLLAEAVCRIKAGEDHFSNDEDESRLLEPQQEAHRDIPMWEEEFISAISEALESERVVVSAKSLRRYFMAMKGAFGKVVQPREYNRVLINHGWARKSRRVRIKNENGDIISTKVAVNCWGLREADGAMVGVAYGRMLVYHSESETRPGKWEVEASEKEFDAEFDAPTCRAARAA